MRLPDRWLKAGRMTHQAAGCGVDYQEMAKSSTYQRSLTRAARKRLVQRNSRRLVFAVLIALAINAVVTLLLWPLLSQGALFILEALILGELGLLWFWLVVHDGELHRRMGIMGETWSKDELSWLSKRGWHLFSNVAFERFDVDQVLIGPGGLFAIETKFSSRSDASQDVAAAAGQAIDNARKIKLLLGTYQVSVHVTPVLFLWGPGYREMELEGFRNVTIVQGNDVHSWVRALITSPMLVEEGRVKQAADAIRKFQSMRQEYESSETGAAARRSRESSRKAITPAAPTATT